MTGDKIDAISLNKKNKSDFEITNYFLEAQKKTAALGQGIKKKMPPIFDNYLSNNHTVQTFGVNSYGSHNTTCADN